MQDVRFIVWVLEMWGLRHFVEEVRLSVRFQRSRSDAFFHLLQVSMKYIMDTAPKKYHGFLIPKFPFGCKRVGRLLRFFAGALADPVSFKGHHGPRISRCAPPD